MPLARTAWSDLLAEISAARDLAVIRRILIQGWRYKWMIALTIASTAAMGGLMGTLLWQIVTKIPELIKQGGSIGSIEALGAKVLLMAPIAAICGYCSWWSGQWVANRCMMDLRDQMVAHLTRLDLAFHGELSRGDLLTRLTADLENMLGLQQVLYGRLLQRPLEGLGWVAALLFFDWRMGLGVLAVLAVATAAIAPVLRRTRDRSHKARQTLARNFSALEQVTAGIRVIKAMGSSEREIAHYAGNNRALFDDNMRVARARAQSDALTQGAIFALVGAGIVTGAVLYSYGGIEPMKLIMFLGVLARLITVMREVQRGWGDAQERLPAVERVYAVLDRPSRITDRNGAIPCPPPRKAITIEGVRFRYAPDSDDVLRGLDLEIPVGKTVALVGESGSGKSTLLDLIPRFHDVTGGRIAIDGVDIRDYQVESLVHNVAIVQQDSFLFNDTVYANIAYGRPGASREQVEEAARRAHVHDAILGLEGGLGYETPVGDRGGRLSGGQRQRVAIARALLRDAPILLLDEPTSALDADSERHVQEALQELMRGRTTIVVAHRLATIQHADLIYVLAGKDDPRRGTVLEQGSHLGLVGSDGEYARLVRLQQLAT